MALQKYQKFTSGLILLLSIASFTSGKIVVNKETFKQSLKAALMDESQQVYEFGRQIKDQHVIIFFGSNRCSKITLVNHLLGTKLQVCDMGTSGLNAKEYGISDGPSFVSHFAIPAIYTCQGKSDFVFVDLPGFDDTRDALQNVITAMFVNQIKYAKTVKFVMVVDFQDIVNHNLSPFLKSLEQIKEFLSDEHGLYRYISMIFMQVPSQYDQRDVVNLLRRQVAIAKLGVSQQLVQNIVDNYKRIGIIRPVTSTIGKDFEQNIKELIEIGETIQMNDFKITFTLSDEAREALMGVYQEYLDPNYFTTEFDRVLEAFGNFFKDKWVFASYDEELNSTKNALVTIEASVRNQSFVKRKTLYHIQRSLETVLGCPVSYEFVTSFEVMVMLDNSSVIEDQDRKVIENNFENSLTELLGKINLLQGKVDTEVEDRKKHHVIFPSKRNFLATSYTITHALLSKTYGITFGAFETLLHTITTTVKELPKKDSLPGAVFSVLNTASSVKSPTLESLCSAAEKAVQVAVKYLPEGLAVGGAVGVGFGGSSAYFVYQEIYGRRFEVRRLQNRDVYCWL